VSHWTRAFLTSPRLRGEVGSQSDPGEGASPNPRLSFCEMPPHPDPLPARGERERAIGLGTAQNYVQPIESHREP